MFCSKNDPSWRKKETLLLGILSEFFLKAYCHTFWLGTFFCYCYALLCPLLFSLKKLTGRRKVERRNFFLWNARVIQFSYETTTIDFRLKINKNKSNFDDVGKMQKHICMSNKRKMIRPHKIARRWVC